MSQLAEDFDPIYKEIDDHPEKTTTAQTFKETNEHREEGANASSSATTTITVPGPISVVFQSM